MATPRTIEIPVRLVVTTAEQDERARTIRIINDFRYQAGFKHPAFAVLRDLQREIEKKPV